MITGPVSLNVTGAGSLVVQSHEDPAYIVEKFSAMATEAGVPFNEETMDSMMDSLCASRSCFRRVAPRADIKGSRPLRFGSS